MGRGFFLGLFWGLVFAFASGMLVSLLVPLPPSPQVEATAPDASSGAPVIEVDRKAEPDGRDGDLVEIAPTALGGHDNPRDKPHSLDDASTRPAALPEVGGATAGVQRPGDAQSAPDPAVAAETLVSPMPKAAAPNAPSGGAMPLDRANTRPAAIPRVGTATAGLQRPGTAADSPELDAGPDAPMPVVPGTAAPSAPSGASMSLDQAMTKPAAIPRVGTATAGLQRPGTAADSPELDAGPDAPMPVVPKTAAPSAPSGEAGFSISTDPGRSSVPKLSDAGPAFGAPSNGDQAAPDVSGVSDGGPVATDRVAAVARPEPEARPDPSTAPAIAPLSPDAGPQQPQAASKTGTDKLPTAPEEPVAASQRPGPEPAQPAPAPQQPATPAPDEQSLPRLAALPQAGVASARNGLGIGKPVVPLTGRGRTSVILTGGQDEQTASAVPPLTRYATAFENPDAKPLMAIVLIDDAKSLGYEALQDFPYPLSFAIDPAAPDAPARMARYRAAGFEVVLLLDMPAAASARDAEVTLAAGLDALPETVAVLEGVGSGIQGNRDLSAQVTEIAKATGRGLIAQDNGLNTVQKLAARSGVPSAIVFRDFDGAGQTPTIMRRFLDQAAFRAGQQGAVIMLGRVRPDTISALLLWGLQDRASRVALAPVSAVLTGN